MIHNITVKVHHYDEENHSLVVTFGGELNGVHYETSQLSFNPSNYHPTDPGLAIKGIASLGLSYLQSEIDRQNFLVSEDMHAGLKDSINKQFYYIASDLVNADLEKHVSTEIEI